MTESTTRLWLLRHGRPSGGECFRGRTDLPLSAAGGVAMGRALERVDSVDRVISSPLLRCYTFAKGWAAQQGCPLEQSAEITELDFGRWDGRAVADVWADEADRVQAFWSNPYRNGPPQGERVCAFEARVIAVVHSWLERCCGEQLLVVSHGGVMRALLKWALDLPSDSLSHLQALELGYASLIELEVFTDADGRHWPRLMALYPAPNDALPADTKESFDE